MRATFEALKFSILKISIGVLTTFFLSSCSTSPAKPGLVSGSASDTEVRIVPKVVPGSPEATLEGRYRPVVGTRGMVVADDRVAAEWGAEILRKGGNAVDAAVATAFAMSVTRPNHSSIGGGGFMVYCPAPKGGKKSNCVTLDYREVAPAAATRDLYIRDGKPRTDLSQVGALASGVPGVTSGLLTALEKYGSMPRQRLLSRPIQLARQGFVWNGGLEAVAEEQWSTFNDETKRIFGCDFHEKKVACPANTKIRQPELALTLETIARSGMSGFYEGWVARKIVDSLHASGGIMTLADLKAYRAKWREPVKGEVHFRGHTYEVVSMPPPSAGGSVLLQMLGYAERADDQGEFAEGYGSARTLHAMAHGMSLAFADRAKHFGDPDRVHVPVEQMISSAYLDSRWKSFNPSKAALPEAAGELSREGNHTTHFSVIDSKGNAVAITTTINENFGSGFTPPGTGVVMNNEMDDFSVQPGTPNLFGLVGAEANSVAAGKRPLSSMSPTVVRDTQGEARIIVGGAGGPRITTLAYQTLLNRMRFDMSIVDALAAPRIHQQWKPTDLRYETNGFSYDTLKKLQDMGYVLKATPGLARGHALERFANGRVWGAPDFRADGAAVAE